MFLKIIIIVQVKFYTISDKKKTYKMIGIFLKVLFFNFIKILSVSLDLFAVLVVKKWNEMQIDWKSFSGFGWAGLLVCHLFLF